jgi:endonuclease/exonuclease/phosphatase family metal-dependent hydrolase
VPSLRVAVWNVHGLRGGVREAAGVLGDPPPDLAVLNETGYLGFRLRRLARRVGMRPVSGLGLFRRIPNAVLVRAPWRTVEHRVEVLPREGRHVRRGLVLAVAGRAGARVVVGSMHLGLSPTERVAHARRVTDVLAGRREPVLLGGDLNEGPDGPASGWLRARYWDAFELAGKGGGPTFPAAEPRARIDYLFVSEGMRIRRAWVGEASDASDHLPLFAEVDVEG